MDRSCKIHARRETILNFMVEIESLPEAQHFLDTDHQLTRSQETALAFLHQRFSLIEIREEFLSDEEADASKYIEEMRSKLFLLISGLPDDSYWEEQAERVRTYFNSFTLRTRKEQFQLMIFIFQIRIFVKNEIDNDNSNSNTIKDNNDNNEFDIM